MTNFGKRLILIEAAVAAVFHAVALAALIGAQNPTPLAAVLVMDALVAAVGAAAWLGQRLWPEDGQ